VGAIDQGKKVGMDLGVAIDFYGKLGISISRNPQILLKNTDADIILHATVSFLDQVYPQIAMGVEVGMDTISICEDIAFLWYRYPELANKIDRPARVSQHEGSSQPDGFYRHREILSILILS